VAVTVKNCEAKTHKKNKNQTQKGRNGFHEEFRTKKD
jgi:hypothetical protein